MIKRIVLQNKGLTLVELMIVLVLSVLLMSAAWLSYQAQHKGGRVQEQVALIQQDLRTVMDIMEKDIRNAGCDPCMTGIAPLTANTSGGRTLGVQYDPDTNSATCPHATMTHTRYYVNANNQLLRNGEILIENVTSFGVSYTNAAGGSIASSGGVNTAYSTSKTLDASQIEDIRTVEIDVVVRSARPDPDTDQYVNRSMLRRVRMRN